MYFNSNSPLVFEQFVKALKTGKRQRMKFTLLNRYRRELTHDPCRQEGRNKRGRFRGGMVVVAVAAVGKLSLMNRSFSSL